MCLVLVSLYNVVKRGIKYIYKREILIKRKDSNSFIKSGLGDEVRGCILCLFFEMIEFEIDEECIRSM